MIHSTETAVCRVSNDILKHGDGGEVLIGLSAASDMVDQGILTERL